MNKKSMYFVFSTFILISSAIVLYFRVSSGEDKISQYISTHTTNGIITEISSTVDNVQTYRGKNHSISSSVVYFKIKHANGFEEYKSEQNPLIYWKFNLGDSIDFMRDQGYNKLYHLERIGYTDIPKSIFNLVFSSLSIFVLIALSLFVGYVAFIHEEDK